MVHVLIILQLSSVYLKAQFLVLYFLICIIDLEKNIKSNIKLFADDTMLFSTVKVPIISANDLNHDFDKVGTSMENGV